MHTIEDEKNIKEYEKYILRNGIDRSVIDAYCEASKIILCGRKDREYGLKVSTRAKELIFEYIKSITNSKVNIIGLEVEYKYKSISKKLASSYGIYG